MQPPEGHRRRVGSDPGAIAGNIRAWTRVNAEYTDEWAERAWREEEITWGVFDVSESSLNSPLGIVEGLDVVELGCGTAYICAWLAKRGARPVGVDPTPAQLASAKRAQDATGIQFPLIEAPAEQVPLPDATFDLAVSEYGASLWADPALWIPEAARLLRSGGRLVFLTNSMLVYLCSPDEGLVSRTLRRPQFGMYRITWSEEPDGTEYHLSHGDWIRLLRANGFDIENLIEVQAPPDAQSPVYYDYVTVEWGRQWPAEEIWVARKRIRGFLNDDAGSGELVSETPSGARSLIFRNPVRLSVGRHPSHWTSRGERRRQGWPCAGIGRPRVSAAVPRVLRRRRPAPRLAARRPAASSCCRERCDTPTGRAASV